MIWAWLLLPIAQLAKDALDFYAHGAPVACSLFADPELLARQQQAMRQAGAGPHKAFEHLAAYLRAEQRIGRVAHEADVDAAAGLFVGRVSAARPGAPVRRPGGGPGRRCLLR